jgi:hypothetical protein
MNIALAGLTDSRTVTVHTWGLLIAGICLKKKLFIHTVALELLVYAVFGRPWHDTLNEMNCRCVLQCLGVLSALV